MNGRVIHYIKQHYHFVKLSVNCFVMCNLFNITCCINRNSFSDTCKTPILVTFYIVLCPQNLLTGFRNVLDPVVIVANVLKPCLPYCSFSFL